MSTARSSPDSPLLEVRGICKGFAPRRLFGARRVTVAAQDVAFQIARGEAVALVGESGSGKSTMARILLRLEQPDRGQIILDGEDVLAREPRRASLGYRSRVQMVFQDPFGSLNPMHSVAHHIVRPLLRHRQLGSLNPEHSVTQHLERPVARFQKGSSAAAIRARVAELLRTVGLEPAEEYMDRRPYELSGGQRQRVAIARALAVEPDLLVADEPTSMLDVSIRMGVLNLLAHLKKERDLAILLITHDLASARYLADRILVLYRGRVVEDGRSQSVVESPRHPYTQELLGAIADVDRPRSYAVGQRAPSSGEEDGARNGCPFAPRCAHVLDVCRAVEPEPFAVGDQRVRCHLYASQAN